MVVLRLARHGTKKKPAYRIVATNKENSRNGKFLEIVGTYNPMVEPAAVTLNDERVKVWLGLGAKTTDVVRSMIVKRIPGLIEEKENHRLEKIRSARRKRKERAKAKA